VSFSAVQAAMQAAMDDIIRPPKQMGSEKYIGTNSINLLKRELGLG
jgi:GntR family transcriptional regulator